MAADTLRAQRALHRLFRLGGVDSVPLEHERLRPLLVALRSIADRCGCGIAVFEHLERKPMATPERTADRLMLGLLALPDELPKIKDELDELLEDREVRDIVTSGGKGLRAEPVGRGIPGVLIFHDDLWLPTAALLRERQH